MSTQQTEPIAVKEVDVKLTAWQKWKKLSKTKKALSIFGAWIVLMAVLPADDEAKAKSLCTDKIIDKYVYEDPHFDQYRIAETQDDGTIVAIVHAQLTASGKSTTGETTAVDQALAIYWNANSSAAGWNYWRCSIKNGKAESLRLTTASDFDAIYSRQQKK